VLILVPGSGAGAGVFTLVARELVAEVPGLAVWAVDRREEALEDTSVFVRAFAGRATAQQAYDYYLRWVVNSRIHPHYRPLADNADPFARQWGATVLMNDLHRVVLAARRGGRTVILGGHSLGASEAVMYATWDFAGRAGYRDLKGIVLIDGGLLGSFPHPTLAAVRHQLTQLQNGSPFESNLWVTGVIGETAGLFAEQDPAGTSVLQKFPLMSELVGFPPSFPITNRALVGWLYDYRTSPYGLGSQVRSGMLASTGTPRDWVDSGISPVERVAALWSQEPNALDWYYPLRLELDVRAADQPTRNPITKLLGLRTWHLARVNVPLYAFETSLTNGGVLRGANALIRASRSPASKSVLVDRSSTTSHIDPLTAPPDANDFLQTVEPFLRANR
jgi:hypothetical protein